MTGGGAGMQGLRARTKAFALFALLAVTTSFAPAGATGLSPQFKRFVGRSAHAAAYAWGVATMPDGSMLVGDYWNYRVLHLATDGTFLGTFVNNPGFGAGQNQAPYGLAVDRTNGWVYMADTDRYQINKYDLSGHWLLSFGSGLPEKFKYPSRVAVASDGRVFVVDSLANTISIHQPDGTRVGSFGGSGSADGRFNEPRGAAFDGLDRLWVADAKNCRLEVFDSSGNFLFKVGSKGSQPGQFRGNLRGLAVDKTNHRVYVVDGLMNKIAKFDTDGNFVKRFGSVGTGAGQFTDGGRELAIDDSGNLWVGDMPNFRVQKFTPSGDFLLQYPTPAAPPAAGGFNGPRGVAVDSSGDVFVADTYNQRIEKFAPDGTFLKEWGARGRDGYLLNYPRMIAVDPRNGDVIISDSENNRIKKFDNDGVFKWQVGAGGVRPGEFKTPYGIDVAPDGTIFVADSGNSRIQVLDENGAVLRTFGAHGSGEGQFLFAKGIGVDPDGSVWVSDSTRGDVQHLDAAGDFIGSIGSKGKGDGQLDTPYDVEVDAQHIFVADSGVGYIKVWDRNGDFVTKFGPRKGVMMRQPQGLDLSSAGTLYIGEQKNDRIQEWTL